MEQSQAFQDYNFLCTLWLHSLRNQIHFLFGAKVLANKDAFQIRQITNSLFS